MTEQRLCGRDRQSGINANRHVLGALFRRHLDSHSRFDIYCAASDAIAGHSGVRRQRVRPLRGMVNEAPMPAGTSGTQGDSRLAECEVLDFRRLSKDPLSLQQPYDYDHQNHGQQQMNQAAAEGHDECPEQPDEKKDDNDRFESVTRHEGNPRCFDVDDLEAGIVDANMRQRCAVPTSQPPDSRGDWPYMYSVAHRPQ
jgi:hypothetical protein